MQKKGWKLKSSASLKAEKKGYYQISSWLTLIPLPVMYQVHEK
jgi:hypothetical protein